MIYHITEKVLKFWNDISGTGNPVILNKDMKTPPIGIGFPFEFFGETYTDVVISSRGGVLFSPFYQRLYPTSEKIPTPGGIADNAIWALFDYLEPPYS